MKLRLYKSKKTIMGCDARGDGQSAYLTRYVLLETGRGNLNLHHFHRSDSDDQHSHPWNFWSVVLWPGYLEVTPNGNQRRWPLIPVYRPAEWQHRVQLLRGICQVCHGTGITDGLLCKGCGDGRLCGVYERPCWTLIWTGPKFRRWGFFTPRGYQDWMDYFREKGC